MEVKWIILFVTEMDYIPSFSIDIGSMNTYSSLQGCNKMWVERDNTSYFQLTRKEVIYFNKKIKYNTPRTRVGSGFRNRMLAIKSKKMPEISHFLWEKKNQPREFPQSGSKALDAERKRRRRGEKSGIHIIKSLMWNNKNHPKPEALPWHLMMSKAFLLD